jgi:hypothetical protein
MNLSAPAQTTKAYQRKQKGIHDQLATFLKEKGCPKPKRRKAAIERAGVRNG